MPLDEEKESAWISADMRPARFAKAYVPMEVTLEGMVTETRDVHPLKADAPMLVTPSAMVTVLMDALSSYHGARLELE